jgi:hypothetical protein
VPRRNRRAPEPAVAAPLRRPTFVPPEWACADDASVRAVTGDKPYLCPGCQHTIRAGVQHLVVVESEDVEGRRHWHTECWRRELRRRGHRV